MVRNLSDHEETVTVSLLLDGWEGHGFRIAAILPAAIPAGRRYVSLRPDGVEFVDGVPPRILVDVPSAPRRKVPKSLVTQRVIAAAKIDQAIGLLQMHGRSSRDGSRRISRTSSSTIPTRS